jgi:glucosamine-phosphate N-acetyltransferase
MRAAPETYYALVILDRASDKIIGVGSLFIERKFLRGLGRAGHIEDIAVDKQQQGKKVGLRVINALTYISESIGCYKTILNCSESNIREWRLLLHLAGQLMIVTTPAFYEKCGFEKKECEMVCTSCSRSVPR